MAVLSNVDRIAIWKAFMAINLQELGLTKPELRAAVDAADAWADANAASYNSALPLPARSVLTAAQKARILSLVITRRYEVS